MSDPQLLTRDLLVSPAATEVLGTIARARLWEDGCVTFFLNVQGQVETAPLYEVQLDALPEAEAISRLQAKNYVQEQLINYLKGRDARSRLEGSYLHL
jgi:hypothetical protein